MTNQDKRQRKKPTKRQLIDFYGLQMGKLQEKSIEQIETVVELVSMRDWHLGNEMIDTVISRMNILRTYTLEKIKDTGTP